LPTFCFAGFLGIDASLGRFRRVTIAFHVAFAGKMCWTM
jgi:hypothetical protein